MRYFMATANTNRNKNVAELDFYTSPPDFVEQCFKRGILDNDINWRVYEPFAGNGHISNLLKDKGLEVITNDIVERAIPLDFVQDYFSKDYKDPEQYDIVVTNPPYKQAQKFVELCLPRLKKSDKLVVLLRLDFLTSQARGKFFTEVGQLKEVHIYSYRIKCLKEGIDDGASSAVNYAIFVWEAGYKGSPTISWITK